MSSKRPPSVTMVLFGVRTTVFLLGGRVIAMGVWFLVAGAGVYLTVGGSYVGGWDRLCPFRLRPCETGVAAEGDA
jgi:hypothetical protein